MKKLLLFLLLCSNVFAKNIVLNPGQNEFEIATTYNAGTGYSWYIKSFDKHVLSLLSVSSKSPNKSIGGKIILVWRFKVNKNYLAIPQIINVNFILMRPWEGVADKNLDVQVIIPGNIRYQ
jgi:predicted secreted protein